MSSSGLSVPNHSKDIFVVLLAIVFVCRAQDARAVCEEVSDWNSVHISTVPVVVRDVLSSAETSSALLELLSLPVLARGGSPAEVVAFQGTGTTALSLAEWRRRWQQIHADNASSDEAVFDTKGAAAAAVKMMWAKLPAGVVGLADHISAIGGWPLLSLAPSSGGLAMHVHGASWLLQVEGEKSWRFYAATEVPVGARAAWPSLLLAKNVVDAFDALPAPPLACRQRVGDLVWVPPGWWHTTRVDDKLSTAIGGQAPWPESEHVAASLVLLSKASEWAEAQHLAGVALVRRYTRERLPEDALLADKYFLRALAMDPLEARCALALAKLRGPAPGALDAIASAKAAAANLEARGLKSVSAAVWRRIGEWFANGPQKNASLAAELLAQAVSLDPKCAAAALEAGVQFLRVGAWEQAAKHLRHGLRLPLDPAWAQNARTLLKDVETRLAADVGRSRKSKASRASPSTEL